MTTKESNSTPIDLFGNPTLTPREIMQQQLQRLIQESQADRANIADPRVRAAGGMGTAVGGMLGTALMKMGVIEKPEKVKRAERLAAARDAIAKDAKEKGLSPESNPTEFADLAASHFLRAGDEQAALMAINWRNLQEANKRTADLERAKLENVQADTALKNRKPGEGSGRGEYFVPVETADGVRAFDARRGVLVDPATQEVITKPVVGTKSDPKLRGDIKFAEESGQEGGKNLFTQRQVAMDAYSSLLGIGEARKLLDEGMKTGKFANFEVGLGATLQELGITFADDEVENAQAFVASQAKQVAAIIKAFGAGTGLSDADREFAIKAAGGDIAMNEKSIRKVLDINERASLNVIKNYKDLYGRVKKEYLPYSMELPDLPKQSKGKSAGGASLPSGWKVKAK